MLEYWNNGLAPFGQDFIPPTGGKSNNMSKVILNTKGYCGTQSSFNLIFLKTKGGHGLHRFFQVANHDRLNEKFLRGVQGGSFFKKRPPGLYIWWIIL